MVKVKEHNVQTNEIIIRDMNDDELAKWHQDNERIEKESVAQAQAADAKAALLDKLGITEQEAKLLLGGN